MEETFLPWRDVPQTRLDRVYIEKGFFPALRKGEQETVQEVHPFEHRQAVAVTLDSAYDDWCMSEWAKLLGKQDDYEYFLKRAHNYENVFDKRTGFMCPKSEDGEWVLDPKEYSPIWSGGQGGREYYSEMNGWIFTFSVQHDLAGLINLIGGREVRRQTRHVISGPVRGISGRSSAASRGRIEVLLLRAISGPDRTDRPVCHRRRTELPHSLSV